MRDIALFQRQNSPFPFLQREFTEKKNKMDPNFRGVVPAVYLFPLKRPL